MNNTPIAGRIVLAGNPNVGKSTLFNLLTGKKVHTGNWSGKTVSVSEGYGVHNNKKYIIEDLPGIASITNPDAEELSAFRTIISGNYQCCVIVADATHMSRSLALTLRILELTPRCVLFINMLDEAQKRGIKIDSDALSFILGIRVILASARKKDSAKALMDAAEEVCRNNFSPLTFTPLYSPETENCLASFSYDRKETIAHIHSMASSYTALKADMAATTALLAGKIEKLAVKKTSAHQADRLDKIFCSPYAGIPIMLMLLAFVLYITIIASNYPSQLLSFLFKKGEALLTEAFSLMKTPEFLTGLIVQGVYSTTATVVAVMLPPMVIFFPLFALLEDSGYLPRVAFNLDNTFKKCGSCGKQSLAICMGLGCNCVGISNSAIIPSEKEKLISILTNSFTPCNGRFGAILACISVFLAPQNPLLAALIMALVLVFSFFSTILASKFLSVTLPKSKSAPFVLELPHYRKPEFFKVIASSITEHTPKILLRAIAVSAPMGALIFALNRFNLLLPIANFLNPFASLMGLDGIILLAFILSFPANEIVFPITLMLYTQSSAMVEYSSYASLYSILYQNNWSIATATSFIIFTLMHWPCSTAALTVKSETGSIKWTIVSILLPLGFGLLFSILSNSIFQLFFA